MDSRQPIARDQARRSYSRPLLREYGSLPELTRDLGSMTVGDGGAPPFLKTA